MNPQEIYSDFILVKQMKAPLNVKIKMLTFLFGAQKNPWRVIGITNAALIRFSEYNFEKVSRMGINRAHLVSRQESYSIMLSENYSNCEEWWNFYYKNDCTILATSTENLSNGFSLRYNIDENSGLFHSEGYSWHHGQAEINFLKSLHNSVRDNPIQP